MCAKHQVIINIQYVLVADEIIEDWPFFYFFFWPPRCQLLCVKPLINSHNSVKQALLLLFYQWANWVVTKLPQKCLLHYGAMVKSQLWFQIVFSFHHAAVIPSLSWLLPGTKEKAVPCKGAFHSLLLAPEPYHFKSPWPTVQPPGCQAPSSILILTVHRLSLNFSTRIL